MTNLLRFEFRKLFKNKAFYICTAVSLFFVLISAITIKSMHDLYYTSVVIEGGEEPVNSLYGMTGLSMLKSGFSNGALATVGAIMVSLIVVEDYYHDTMKNIYAKGYKKDFVFFSKYIVSLVAFFIGFVLCSLLSLLLGATMFDGIGSAGENYAFSIIGLLFVFLAFHAIFFSVTFLIRKTGGAIALNIVGPSAVTLILTMIDSFIKDNDFTLTDYWISSLSSELSNKDVELSTCFTALIVSTIVIAIFITISFFVNKKRDN